MIFVNSMSDLFHPEVPESFISEVFEVVSETPRHTYQLLTKRSKRLATLADRLTWPSNLWVGVSIESDRYAFRADHLRSVPVSVRFISAEPLLGPLPSLSLSGIEWLIAGGESGHHARPVHPEWIRDLRDRCVAARVAFFFKQWGAWTPGDDARCVPVAISGHQIPPGIANGSSQSFAMMRRVGKAIAGRRLDGRTWDELPKAAEQETLMQEDDGRRAEDTGVGSVERVEDGDRSRRVSSYVPSGRQELAASRLH
jgi:protein gp37